MKKVIIAVLFVAFIIFLYFQSQQLSQMKVRIDQIEKKLGGSSSLLCSQDQLLAKVEPTIVRVVGGESEGTGVIVKENGTILTNFHVIEFEPAPTVVFSDYSKHPAEIIMADKNIDIALLKINLDNLAFLPVHGSNADSIAPLTPVYAFGFPSGTDLAGGATVQKGNFISQRKLENIGFIQTDLSLNQGQSGGALTDECGNLIGINTMGLAGLTMALSNQTILDSWFSLLEAEDPLQDVQKIGFNPNQSPLEAVRAFYNYQKIRRMKDAFDLLSPKHYLFDSFEEWKSGYTDVISVDLIDIKADETDPNLIHVKITSKDLVGEVPMYKYFEGTWLVVQEKGAYRLIESNIQEISKPGWEWYYF